MSELSSHHPFDTLLRPELSNQSPPSMTLVTSMCVGCFMPARATRESPSWCHGPAVVCRLYLNGLRFCNEATAFTSLHAVGG